MSDLAELEVELREGFQMYRRRLDLVAKANRLRLTGKTLKQFVAAMKEGDEVAAKKILRIEEVKRA